MPTLTINNAKIHYLDSDPNNTDKPVMVFAHGLLWGTHLYDNQVAYYKDHYRCIRFDFRGQGKSEVTKSGYDMDTLADDAIALIEHLGIKKCTFVGLSMGGFVGQRVAIKRRDLLDALILLETSADAEDPSKIDDYKKLLTAIKFVGMKRISKKVMPIMFGQTFLTDKSRKADYKTWLKHLNANHKKGARLATKGVIERDAVIDKLANITTPTLVIVGDEDVATPYDKAERIHFAIEGSKFAVIQGAGHTVTVEEPDKLHRVMDKFLKKFT